MNRAYKVLWSRVKNCFVVVSELAKGNGKVASSRIKGKTAVAAVVAALLTTGYTWGGICGRCNRR